MYICIDFGGTNIRGALINGNREIIKRYRVRTEASSGYEKVCSNLYGLIDELGKDIEYKGIGIGFPGTVTKDSEIITAPNLGWENINLGKILEEKYKVRVKIDNDVNMALRGEKWVGAGKDYENIFMLTIGTGVGGALILSGKLFGGKDNNAGEIGHINVEKDGILCGCGKKGCLEQYASATAIINYVEKRISQGEKTELTKYETLEAEEIFECAKKRDKLAIEAVDRMAWYIGIGISSVVNLLNPECIIIGGGVSHAGEYLLGKIRNSSEILCLDYSYKGLQIKLAELGDEAGIFGSAYSLIG